MTDLEIVAWIYLIIGLAFAAYRWPVAEKFVQGSRNDPFYAGMHPLTMALSTMIAMALFVLLWPLYPIEKAIRERRGGQE